MEGSWRREDVPRGGVEVARESEILWWTITLCACFTASACGQSDSCTVKGDTVNKKIKCRFRRYKTLFWHIVAPWVCTSVPQTAEACDISNTCCYKCVWFKLWGVGGWVSSLQDISSHEKKISAICECLKIGNMLFGFMLKIRLLFMHDSCMRVIHH